ncbi:MAG TPA: biotin/lipoyl-binding protein, partial [Candidatus Woesebacteria bacterium]|nr:biotin/lipoyl-binding protein [Candidatus Woesebacteria bacterium]
MKKTLTNVFAFLKKHFKLFLVIIVLGLLGFWLLQRDSKQQASLVFVSPVREDIVASITISGRVDAKEKARLRFASGGKVVYLGAKEGDSVKKGQIIATIDRSTLQKQLDQNLNTYMQKRNDFENIQDDIKDRTLDT